MGKNFRAILMMVTVFLISLSLVSLTFAMPPGHAKRANTANHELMQENKTMPPGLANKGTPPGLVNKGGLPPGLQGRTYEQLPPGIRNNPNFREAVEKLKEQGEKPDEKELFLFVTGSKYLVVPSEGVATSTYKALLADEDGKNGNEVMASWYLDEEKTGVSIDDNGVLSITAAAQSGTIEVMADFTSGEGEAAKSYSGSLTVDLYRQEIGEIKLSGKEFVALTGDETEPLELKYTATVKDQKGNTMEGVSLHWNAISLDYENIFRKLDGATYTIEIPPTPGKFTVIAANGEIKDEIEVTVYLPAVESVEIEGPEFVALQGDEELPLVLEYTATVKDQKGRTMEDKEIVWSADLAPGLAFVNGKVTVADFPATGEEKIFTVRATYEVNEEVYKRAEMEVFIYHPNADDVKITGPAEITLPEPDKTVIKNYEATVLDQHGQEMEKTVNWFLGDNPTGVTLEDGKLTVTSEAVKGTILIWVYYEAFYSFELTII